MFFVKKKVYFHCKSFDAKKRLLNFPTITFGDENIISMMKISISLEKFFSINEFK